VSSQSWKLALTEWNFWPMQITLQHSIYILNLLTFNISKHKVTTFASQNITTNSWSWMRKFSCLFSSFYYWTLWIIKWPLMFWFCKQNKALRPVFLFRLWRIACDWGPLREKLGEVLRRGSPSALNWIASAEDSPFLSNSRLLGLENTPSHCR